MNARKHRHARSSHTRLFKARAKTARERSAKRPHARIAKWPDELMLRPQDATLFIEQRNVPDRDVLRACFKIVAAEVTRLISLHQDAGFPTIFEPRYLGCYNANRFSKRALRDAWPCRLEICATVEAILLDEKVPRPVSRFRFGYPEGLPRADHRRAGRPFIVIIGMRYIFLAVPVEEMDDISVRNRKSQIFQAPRLWHQRAPNRKARGNRHRKVPLRHLARKTVRF